MENIYLKQQKEKIMSFAKDLFKDKNITQTQLQETYFNLYIKNNARINNNTTKTFRSL